VILDTALFGVWGALGGFWGHWRKFASDVSHLASCKVCISDGVLSQFLTFGGFGGSVFFDIGLVLFDTLISANWFGLALFDTLTPADGFGSVLFDTLATAVGFSLCYLTL
jgi:hypothetical protein